MKKPLPTGAVLVPDDAQLVFKGKIFDTYQWPQQLFDGSTRDFEMLKRPDTVVAICVVDDQIIILDDAQPHFGGRASFPGGRVEPSDGSLEAAVAREVVEETGYRFAHWRLIDASQPYKKIEWFVYRFLAWGVTENGQPHPDQGEKITVRKESLSTLKSKAHQDERYLGEANQLLTSINSIEDLLRLPAYDAPLIDR